jgi:cytidyltransferase-like protein
MFHIGHLNLLRRAKEQCDYLIVGVMSDDRVFRLKNKHPVIPCHERMQVVAGCRYADRVEELAVDRADIRDAYHLFHFDCMFSGDDHADNKGWLEDREYLRGLGSDIVFLPYTQETSSTMIKEKLDGR